MATYVAFWIRGYVRTLARSRTPNAPTPVFVNTAGVGTYIVLEILIF